MCGIICTVSRSNSEVSTDLELFQRIKNRGPDAMQSTYVKVNDTNISLSASILWMQGSQLTRQPVENDRGILLYNGDIFDEQWNWQKSDTEQIMERLDEAAKVSTENTIKELECLKGPFSIIYYDKNTSNLLFTRDKIGRNSLLLYKNNDYIVISSVLGRNYESIEIPATHIYILNVITNRLKLISWTENDNIDCEIGIDEWIQSIKSQQSIPDEEFSVHDKETCDFVDKDNIVELIEGVSKKSSDKLVCFQNLLSNPIIDQIVLKILQKLDKSVEIRLLRQPKKCKDCLGGMSTCNHSAVGILFSGGLDCTILALLANKYVDKQQSIDLMNVAFQKDSNSTFEVPDRLTGRQSLKELRKLCPERRWIFKEINISREKLSNCQEQIIADLVFPRQTILDESLGSALWFAAQGVDQHMQSPCRVLLLGSGADELFGGYTRHRNAFKRTGWTGLAKELLLDWKRISFRNLARDNRVICDHGRQPRMPYLDEDFAEFVLNLQPWFKCFPNEHFGPGVGDKLFLRLVAYHLGLENAALLPKRALQFGSRIANKKEKGSDVSTTFLKKTLYN